VLQLPFSALANDIPPEKGEMQLHLTRTDGVEFGYVYSFIYDKCGKRNLGQKYREALFAKLESCPFTEEAKRKFYKDIALAASDGISKMDAFFFNHTSAEIDQHMADLRRDAQCQHNDLQQGINFLEKKLSEYDAGKIKLEDVIVSVKSGKNLKLGEPVTCEELSKRIYPDGGDASGESSSSLGSVGIRRNFNLPNN
jgi:hypothetical protein